MKEKVVVILERNGKREIRAFRVETYKASRRQLRMTLESLGYNVKAVMDIDIAEELKVPGLDEITLE